MQVLNALGYGLFVAVINFLLLGLVNFWWPISQEMMLGCCLGVPMSRRS